MNTEIKLKCSSRRSAIVFMAWTLIPFGTIPAAAQNLVPNGTFDSDVSGWQPNEPLPPATSFFWDGSMGIPPGSAALDTSLDGSALVRVSSPCFPSAGEGVYRWLADLYGEHEGNEACFLVVEQHESADCSGVANSTADYPEFCEDPTSECPPYLVGIWNHLDTLIYVGPKTQAFRVQFGVQRLAGQVTTTRCRLDNFALRAPEGVAVPALGLAGIAVLVTLLSLAAIRVLRARRGH